MTGAGDGVPDATVVVVTHQSEPFLDRCLTAVAEGAARRVIEVVVVDAASTDRSLAIACEHGARVVTSTENRGFAWATNVGIRHGRGRHVVLANPDAFPDPGSIDALLDRLELSPRIGLVGAVLRYPDGRPQPSAGGFPTLTGQLFTALGLHRVPLLSRLAVGVLANPRHYARPHRVDWVTGAFCAARRDAGPLPERAFLYGEDVEWAHAAARRGFQAWVEPGARAVHVLTGGGGATRKQVLRVAFDDRWFRPRGTAVWLASRGITVLHAAVRLAAARTLVTAGRLPASADAPWRALLRAALDPGHGAVIAARDEDQTIALVGS